VRLADIILRGGHLSERALAEVCATGERPVHLDRCDICSGRAVQLSRWLDDLRTVAVSEADAAYPAERLAAQQAQILRRLEQLDRPARVIAFPTQAQYDRLAMGRGIRPAWVGIAAAAGVVLGLVGGQVTTRLTSQHAAAPTRPAVQIQQPAAASPAAQTASAAMFEIDENDRPVIDAVAALEFYTPHSVIPSEQVLRTNRTER
jgi:hypothetical protein